MRWLCVPITPEYARRDATMRKRNSLFSLTIVIAFTAMTVIAAADTYVCGDADTSGGVDIDDAVYLINYIFAGGPEPDNYGSGDADASGEIDIDDVVCLISYIFASGPEPMCPYGTITDIDGNVYQTIKIGDQWWMAENLKVIHYRNGDPIPHATEGAPWSELSTGAYCEYGNDPANVETYGRLYNWHAVNDSRNIAPDGWHVPSDAEWKQLEMYLGMNQAEADCSGWRGTDEGGKLKEVGTTHWSSPNEGASDERDFTALPGGCRFHSGPFSDITYIAYFWSSTEFESGLAWYRALVTYSSAVRRLADYRQGGLSVRCVRD